MIRNSTSRKYLAEFVYGATDGTITTFAIIAAVSGASLAPVIILVLGFSNVLADGFSMAASNYLSEKSNDAVGGVNDNKHPVRTSFVTFVSFVVVGSVPLIPFVLLGNVEGINPFSVSIVATALTFLVIGFIRGYVARERGIRTALETLFIGGIAAGIAYGAGAFLETLF
ncbi:hypothetical protein COB55_05220 [Candidatus Wolfebacteria bacterium]|nr:MAG: hypothetical protein COB55_05220 [Candidatus Wolfebacteria bacterium]